MKKGVSAGNIMDYGECQKTHADNHGKVDGCQIFQKRWIDEDTCICGCHQCFHRRIVPPIKYETKIVYTKCHKIHDFKSQATVDGCQEFTPGGKEGTMAALNCALCGCHKGFHRNEITVQVI